MNRITECIKNMKNILYIKSDLMISVFLQYSATCLRVCVLTEDINTIHEVHPCEGIDFDILAVIQSWTE
jgi:hypothetical protein